jgi:hypothetical protein
LLLPVVRPAAFQPAIKPGLHLMQLPKNGAATGEKVTTEEQKKNAWPPRSAAGTPEHNGAGSAGGKLSGLSQTKSGQEKRKILKPKAKVCFSRWPSRGVTILKWCTHQELNLKPADP